MLIIAIFVNGKSILYMCFDLRFMDSMNKQNVYNI